MLVKVIKKIEKSYTTVTITFYKNQVITSLSELSTVSNYYPISLPEVFEFPWEYHLISAVKALF